MNTFNFVHIKGSSNWGGLTICAHRDNLWACYISICGEENFSKKIGRTISENRCRAEAKQYMFTSTIFLLDSDPMESFKQAMKHQCNYDFFNTHRRHIIRSLQYSMNYNIGGPIIPKW